MVYKLYNASVISGIGKMKADCLGNTWLVVEKFEILIKYLWRRLHLINQTCEDKVLHMSRESKYTWSRMIAKGICKR